MPDDRRSSRSGRAARGSLVLLLALVTTAGTALAGPEADYKLAVGYYNTDKFTEAAEHFQKFLAAAPKTDPDVPTARFFLGLSLVSLDEFEKARTALEGYVRNHAEDKYVPDARYNIGWCSYRLGDHERAVREFVSFLDEHEKHPNSEFALVYLGDSRLNLKKPDDAAKAFRAAIEGFPRGTMAEDAHMGLAWAYELQEKFQEAADEYRSVLGNPRGERRGEAQFQLAGRLYDLKKYDESAVEYDAFATAFANDPRVPAAQLNAGFAHYRAGDVAAARKSFDEAAKTESQAVRAGYWSGVSSKQLGEYAAASKTLSAAFEAGKESAEAPRILYQWADAEYLAGRHAEASKLFAQLSQTWPKDELGDDALHEAGNAALRAGEVDEAIRLVNEFKQRYGKSGPFASRQQILAGRIELARKKEGDVDKAVKRFETVLKTSKDESTLQHARYELARANYERGSFGDVVKTLAPILPKVRDEGADSPFVEAFLLQSDALLELKRYEDADAAAAAFLELEPKGPLAPRAVTNRALSKAHLGDRRQTDYFLTQLALLEPGDDVLRRTGYEIAETAYAAEDFAWAAEAYQGLLKSAEGTSYEPAALTGLGWSLYEQKEYEAASDAFGRFVEKFGDDAKLAPEARYMIARSLQDGGKAKEAATAYAAAYEAFAPEEPAPRGAESKVPMRYVFLAGLQAAETLKGLGEVEKADAAFRKIAKDFPEYARMDQLLDHWALLHYNAGQYKEADAIFQRIVDEYGDGELADDARFHLAESANVNKRTDEAAREFAALARDEKSDPYVRALSLSHLVEIEVARGDWKAVLSRAEDYVKQVKAFERTPRELPFVRFRLGEAQLSLGKYDEARKTLEALREAHPEGPITETPWYDRIPILIAEAALELKDYDAVVSEVDGLRERSPECPFLYRGDYLVGRARMKESKFDLARAAFTRVVEDRNGKFTETAAMAQHAIGDSFFRQEDFKNAEREYRRVYVLYKFPEWRDSGLYNAAAMDERLGNQDVAVKSYELLIEQFPESSFVPKARARIAAIRDRKSS